MVHLQNAAETEAHIFSPKAAASAAAHLKLLAAVVMTLSRFAHMQHVKNKFKCLHKASRSVLTAGVPTGFGSGFLKLIKPATKAE